MKKHIRTHILNNTPLRLLLLLVMMAGGVTEVVGQEYKYTINEMVNNEVVRSTKRVFKTVWETDFSSAPTGMTYSVVTSSGDEVNNSIDISKGILYYRQGGGSGDRYMKTEFTGSEFAVTDNHWRMEFDWGASSANQSNSSVSFGTNEGIAFTIEWAKYAIVATIIDAKKNELVTNLPIDGYNIPEMTVLSHFTIIGDKNNGIYLTVTYGGTTYINNVQVSDKFGYPATFNGTLGRAVSHMALDNIKFSTFDDFKVPYRKYNIPNELNYGKVLSNGVELYYRETTSSEYNHPLTLPINSDKSENLEYKVTDDKKDVIFLSEAEDIKGFTLCNHDNAPIRASNAAAAYVASGTGKVELATLNKGTYKMTAVFFNPGNSKVNWHIYADNDEITNYESPSGTNVSEQSFPVFVIENNNTKIYIGEGGGNDRGIDLIYIQRIGEAFDILKWAKDDGTVATSDTIDISEINNDNLNNSKKDLPTHLLNSSGKSITYGSSNTNVASFYEKETLPRIKGVGTTVITAKASHAYGENVDVATYTLNVKGATNVRGDYDKENNTYSFNRPGQTLNTATISIDGISMTYGNNGSTAVLVKSDVGPALKIIDANGFSHPNLNGGVIPVETQYGGTFYKFTPTIDGELTIIGQLDNPVVYRSDKTQQTVRNSNNKTMTVSLEKDRTYYLYNSSTALLLHSFSYKPKYAVKLDYSKKIKVDRTPSIDGFAFNNKVVLQPILSVIDNSSGTSKTLEPSRYTVKYDITRGNNYATLDNNGVLTTNPNTEDGLVTVTATVNGLNENLTATFNLMVLSGEWRFYSYYSNHHNQLKRKGDNNGIYDNDPDVWETTTNSRVSSRNTTDFQYILQEGTYENDPLDIARALQSKNSVRWYNDNGNASNGDKSFFHLFGKSKDAKTNTLVRGGILKVPAQVGMVIDIWAASDSENAEMLINTDGVPSHADKGYSAVEAFDGTPVTYFYIETAYDHYRYIVTKTDKDGFIYIVNSSDNLYFYIKSIKLTTEIVFKEGEDVYVDGKKGEKVENPIQNAGEDDSFSYNISGQTIDFVSENLSGNNGSVQLPGGKYGSFIVTATASGNGILAGLSNFYTVHAIDMVVKETVPATASDDLSWTTEELKGFIEKISYGPNGTDLPDDVKDKVVFEEVSHDETIRKVTFRGEAGKQTLAIEGVGTVVIQAKLGSVVRKITITVIGVALSDRSPVCSNTDSSVSFKINVSPEVEVSYDADQIDADKEWMLKNLLGDLRNYVNSGQADELQLTYDEETLTYTLSRKDGSPFTHGGTMPIRVTYNNGNILMGMLTVAYSSHSWNFENNMLLYDHPTFNGIYKFYTNNIGTDEVNKRLGEWTKNATFDQPIHQGVTNVENDWRFVRKMGSTHPGSKIIYYYNHSVDGDNAMILPETAGLLINSEKNSEQFGVLMEDEDDTNQSKVGNEQPTKGKLFDIKMNGTDVNASGKGYMLRNVMLKLGGELIVPNVKPGQWIEMRWWRHVAGRGERMTLTNLSDVEGRYIDDTYKIGNTEQGTYMFQVKKQPQKEGTAKEAIDNNEYVDAKFHIIDNVYIEIQEVILHEPGWDYLSSMTENLNSDTDIRKQYITSEECVIALGNHVKQIAPNAPCDWQIRTKGMFSDEVVRNPVIALDNDSLPRPDRYLSETETVITVNPGDWGKVYATLTSYTSDYKYVANRKTWTITFGKAPAQKYPYTWDFTKYFNDTKNSVENDDVTEKYEDINSDHDSFSEANPTGSRELRIQTNTWDNGGDEETVVTTDYDTEHYGSFFVNGAQLVSYGEDENYKKYNGVLPETEGLGFKLPNLGDKNNDNVGILKLDMQSNYANKVGADGDNGTWRSGRLAIRGGGSIIVPHPGDKYGNYRIYVKSSAKPDVTNATEEVKDVNSNEGQYKYSFDNDKDVEITFSGDADVYAIAVTNKFKKMTALSGTGWATESRDTIVDHTLTGYLTTNPTKVYAIIEKSDNPVYSDGKSQTVVAVRDQRYVVPERYGLVMKQENIAETQEDKYYVYYVPLFVPAVTTMEDDIAEDEGFNLMRPNTQKLVDPEGVGEAQGKLFKSETEDVEGALGKNYTRFILASRYMTWENQDGKINEPKYEDGEVAAFYRLYLYKSDEEAEYITGDKNATADNLNTLPFNSAYLLLRTSKLNPALWPDDPKSTMRYVGIEGVSDMIFGDENESGSTGGSSVEASGIYNLNGQKLDDNSLLAPGIYIINGKKVIIRKNDGQ